jgi:hypothetical protein
MLISSAYFRNMPEHSSELFRQSEKIVHLGVDSERFAKLLSFLNDGPQARARLDWPSLKAIAETGERYQFDVVPDLVARGAVSLLRTIFSNSRPSTTITNWLDSLYCLLAIRPNSKT